MKRLVRVLRTGLLPYTKSLVLQKTLSQHVLNGTFSNILVITEHPPVYTIGIRTKQYTIQDEERLKRLGAEFHKTNRGGLITFHGPGQLVAYPIVNLKNFQPSMKWFVCHVEKTVIDLCKKYGIEARTTADTGVWVEDRKICAIGVHGSRYVTTHGLALNCCTDLNWFEHIVPCGIPGKGVTSLSEELKEKITIDAALPKFLQSFSDIFGADIDDFNAEETKNLLNSIS
ncbi:putative lipoyltransferase 2, mitochondrial [Culicoides brevitarsis]|uniref:putative lipoyltransferase 2, mitochondrial n=1 Tax=Culicoides brevitarsis TaxID=469753 RepID=UPI00307C6C4D